MKTLDDLDARMRDPNVGSVTLNIAANGKAYATVHFKQADGSFRPDNQWSDSSAAGLAAIFQRAEEAPAPTPAPRRSVSDLL